MARSISLLASRTLVAVVALVAGSLSAACTATVDGGGSGGNGGSGDGSGGSGGKAAPTCEATEADCSGVVCSNQGQSRACTPPNSAPGVQNCEDDGEGALHWGSCQMNGSVASTPLVLAFDGEPVAFASSDRAFDLTGTMSVTTDWPTSATPWLALDRDGNGRIDGGEELFGSATVLAGGARAVNGFVALGELDTDGDGRITPADAAWSKLLVWSDRDGDRASGAGELGSIAERRLLAIHFGYTSAARCDLRHNCEIERASFRWADASGAEHTGAVIDVHLAFQ